MFVFMLVGASKYNDTDTALNIKFSIQVLPSCGHLHHYILATSPLLMILLPVKEPVVPVRSTQRRGHDLICSKLCTEVL